MNGFIDIDYAQVCKDGQMAGGDVFLLSRRSEDGAIFGTLSDGLGSGVKANVLANLTATMAQKYMMNRIDIRRSAGIIMNTLPVCRERKISYSTFTMLDISVDGKIRIIEYDNPECMFFRGNVCRTISKQSHELPERIAYKKDRIFYSTLQLRIGDRLIVFSDGISQSGMGSERFPLGWRRPDIITCIERKLSAEPEISSRQLSGYIVNQALKNDTRRARDDITCGVVYCRRPRNTLIVTGPPCDPSRDALLVKKIEQFDGRVVIAGGTTASIYARESGKHVAVDIASRSRDVPPLAIIDGIDLVTEGMLTLSYCASLLENRDEKRINTEDNAAARLARLLLDSDRVQCIVGTKINEAHQNPDMPVDLGIRRTLVKRLLRALEHNYVKDATVEYV